jgi:hypothetical protein
MEIHPQTTKHMHASPALYAWIAQLARILRTVEFFACPAKRDGKTRITIRYKSIVADCCIEDDTVEAVAEVLRAPRPVVD